VSDKLDNEKKEEGRDIKTSIASLHQLSHLESETLSTEIHLLGQLRDRLSPAARYAGHIQIKYRRVNEPESEQTEYLVEGFPFADRGKPLTGLLVIDKYSTVELEPGKDGANNGQYTGERLYLTNDRKWILAERVGAYSEASGSTSEWEATCRIVTDRSLIEHYSIEVITDGLFEATNKLWEKLTPRLEALKKRANNAHQVIDKLAKLKNVPKIRIGDEAKEPEPKPKSSEGLAAVASTIGKVRSIGHSS
jgi:hypothetical protein